MNKPQPGQIYQHIKGNFYEVLYVGTHTETLEELVIYKPVDKDMIWIRPLSMWNTRLRKNGKDVSRFILVDNIAKFKDKTK